MAGTGPVALGLGMAGWEALGRAALSLSGAVTTVHPPSPWLLQGLLDELFLGVLPIKAVLVDVRHWGNSPRWSPGEAFSAVVCPTFFLLRFTSLF